MSAEKSGELALTCITKLVPIQTALLLVTELMTGHVCAINRLEIVTNNTVRINRIFFNNIMDSRLLFLLIVVYLKQLICLLAIVLFSVGLEKSN